MSEVRTFDMAAILEVLLRHEIQFVIVGGIAAQAQGSPMMTEDLDICHSTERDNLARLAEALVELAAVRRDLEPEIRAPLDARALRTTAVLSLSTQYGSLDLLAAPEPGLRYDVLLRNASRFTVGGLEVDVASIEDLIAMKSFANRPKDQAALHHLGALREEIDRRR